MGNLRVGFAFRVRLCTIAKSFLTKRRYPETEGTCFKALTYIMNYKLTQGGKSEAAIEHVLTSTGK